MTAPLIELTGLGLGTPEGRPLFRDLHLSLGRERVAVVGRNGVGKSSLLAVLAGDRATYSGTRVARVQPYLVPQHLDPSEAPSLLRELRSRSQADPARARMLERERSRAGLPPLEHLGPTPSLGQLRKLALLRAQLEAPALLLLDEPTEDLDERGIDWLREWLARWDGGLVVVSHHRALLRSFRHFFVVAESGCRYVPGSFDELVRQQQEHDAAQERRYVQQLAALADQERVDEQIRRRRARKKNVGRLHELRRCTSRCRLNEKRGYAQKSQAKAAAIRRDRIDTARAWAKAMRRALAVELPLQLRGPELPPPDGEPAIVLDDVSLSRGGRTLWSGLTLALGRERVAVMGDNGTGKTSLLQLVLGRLSPTTGTARLHPARVGSIDQAAVDWESEDDLLTHLQRELDDASLEPVAARLLAHGFPLALAQRPLASLSPGERVRAALLCLYARSPAVELLVLDEPTSSLDLVGLEALQRALRSWPGGLLIATHDRELLDAIGIDHVLHLDGSGQVQRIRCEDPSRRAALDRAVATPGRG